MNIAKTFKALSEPIRRDILNLLKTGRLSAGEIAEKLEISPAALSYHLKLLKQAELVVEYKYKNYIYYELNTSIFDDLVVWFSQFGGNTDEI